MRNQGLGARHFLAVLSGVCIAVLCTSVAQADKLVTQSGQEFEGKVVEEAERYILIAPNGGKMPFAKSMVREVIRTETPQPETPNAEKPAAQQPAAQPQQAAPPDKDSQVTLYMEVPIVGEFGKDVLPEGVKHCLEYCAQNANIKHVVFRIKSAGGEVKAADDIQGLMKKYEGRFKYHALIEQAMSVAVWVVFCCDTIHMADGSSVGGAAPVPQKPTGVASVDAKLTAGTAALLAATAMAKNHSPVLAKALIAPEAEAYAWLDSGKVSISEVRPQGVSSGDLIVADTPNTLLAMTQDQAVRAGFAKPVQGGSDALGASLGLPGWRKASTYTESAMLRTKLNREKAEAELAAAIRRNTERTATVVAFIKSNLAEAAANDPSRFRYTYDVTTGYLTADSAQRWTKQTDLAVAAWRRVQSGLVEFRKLDKEAEQLGIKKAVPDLNMTDLYGRAEREISRLMGERRRLTP